jgi:ATP-dependent DNA helicase RecQ
MRLGFPDLAQVRRAYQALANLHGIALGAGAMESYALPLRTLAERAALPMAAAAQAYKALELGGFLALSDGARSPSRILILADHRTIYRLRVGDARHGPVLEALLRMHGGLFEEAVSIDEERLARSIGRPLAEVESRLKELDRLGVIAYQPRSDEPMATLLLPRVDADRLVLDPAALRDRAARAEARLRAMLDYLREETACRMARVMDYFGEPGAADCQVCDNCIRRARLAAYPPLGADEAMSTLHERWSLDEYGSTEPPRTP